LAWISDDIEDWKYYDDYQNGIEANESAIARIKQCRRGIEMTNLPQASTEIKSDAEYYTHIHNLGISLNALYIYAAARITRSRKEIDKAQTAALRH
jgi:hypothetical protein